jgi:hypothetical protein
VNHGTEWWHWAYGDRYWATRLTVLPPAMGPPTMCCRARATAELSALRLSR